MSTKTMYPPGVPCWVAVMAPDVDEARNFYGAVFGWDFRDVAAPGNPPFLIALHRGDPVASIAGPQQPGTWITAVAVADLDATVDAVASAGGAAPGATIDIPTLGRFHRLEDPAGAEIHVVQLVPGGGARRVNEPAAWAMSSLAVGDVSSVAPFYERVFGWQAEVSQGFSLFRLPGYVGGEPDQPVPRDVVAVGADDDSGGVAWTPDFWVADTDAAAGLAAARGGRVIRAPDNNELGFRSAVLADPGGAVFSIDQLLRGT